MPCVVVNTYGRFEESYLLFPQGHAIKEERSNILSADLGTRVSFQ